MADFATTACANFSKLLPELDPKGTGLQAPHENGISIWESKNKDILVIHLQVVHLLIIAGIEGSWLMVWVITTEQERDLNQS